MLLKRLGFVSASPRSLAKLGGHNVPTRTLIYKKFGIPTSGDVMSPEFGEGARRSRDETEPVVIVGFCLKHQILFTMNKFFYH